MGIPVTCPHPLPLQRLDDIVKERYPRFQLNDESAVAYKGGHLERDLLERLQIPSIYLEKWGCPKVKTQLPLINNCLACEHHVITKNAEHCPKTEVKPYDFLLESFIEKKLLNYF